MARRYRWRKGDEWSPDQGLTRHMAVAALKVVQGKGPFALTQDGVGIAAGKSRADILSRYRSAIKNREIGSTFRIRKGSGDVCFTGRAVQDLTADSTNGNDKADKFYNWIRATYPHFHPRFAGAYVCKSSSQHARGNADDFFFDTLAQQDRVYDDIKHGKCPVPIAHAISQRAIWSPDGGEHYYSGDFHGHLHVDFLPNFSTSPCGVRD